MSTPEIIITKPDDPITQALAKFNVTDASISEMGEMYADLTTNGPEDTKALKAVKEARLNFRNVRLAVDRVHKHEKADALKLCQAIDGEARRIKALIEPHESRLKAEEDKVAAELQRRADEEARKAREETERRVKSLSDLGAPFALSVIESMTQDEFDAYLASETARVEDERRKAAEAKAEADRVAAEQAKVAEEQKRVAAEQAAEAQKIEDARRDVAEKAQQAAREAAEARAKVEADKAEAARAEQAAAEKRANEAEQARKAEAAKAEQAVLDAEREAEERRVAGLAPIERVAERLDELSLVLACPELSEIAAHLREVAL